MILCVLPVSTNLHQRDIGTDVGRQHTCDGLEERWSTGCIGDRMAVRTCSRDEYFPQDRHTVLPQGDIDFVQSVSLSIYLYGSTELYPPEGKQEERSEAWQDRDWAHLDTGAGMGNNKGFRYVI